MQFGNTVFGIEGDVNAFSLSASRYASVSPPFTNPVGQIVTVGTTLDTDWLATIRGRLGYAVTPMTLLYVTGGGALTSLKVSNSISDNAASLGFTTGSGGANHSEIKLGWTIGGGAEFALDSHWTLKAEYLYVDFGAVSVNSTFTSPGTSRGANSFGSQADLTANIARMGLNYKF